MHCVVVVDCKVSEWTAWDACDKKCGGGQKQRHREIVQPPNGGIPCPPDLVMTQGCNSEPCGRTDCKTSDWTAWSTCPITCGTGQQERTRVILEASQAGGEGCEEALTELRPCKTAEGKEPPPCSVTDCLWEEWSDWSSCSCDCDGGQRVRDRHIKRIAQKGGKPCEPHAKEEIAPCNTQKCSKKACRDAKWDDWEEWTPCSKTCEGGLTNRVRTLAVKANSCGKPAAGVSRMYASCNQGKSCQPSVDCEFGEWGEWSACTADCNGVKRRSRIISVVGKGQGKFCVGTLKQTGKCNPSVGQDVPAKCQKKPPAPCELTAWQEWGICSATCDGGQQSRARSIQGDPAVSGPDCLGALSETRGCSTKPCPVLCTPVDCQWGHWSQWSACDKCGGEKKRTRHVQVLPTCLGKPCAAEAAEEATNCTRKCHEPTYCAFGDWKDWGLCSTSCGHGIRSRIKNLELRSAPEAIRVLTAGSNEKDAVFSQKFDQLEQMADTLQTRRLQEMVVAFACGLMSLVVGLFLVRIVRRPRSGYTVLDPNAMLNVSVE